MYPSDSDIPFGNFKELIAATYQVEEEAVDQVIFCILYIHKRNGNSKIDYIQKSDNLDQLKMMDKKNKQLPRSLTLADITMIVNFDTNQYLYYPCDPLA